MNLQFENGCDREVIAKIDTWLVKKSPDRYRVDITSQIFHEDDSYAGKD